MTRKPVHIRAKPGDVAQYVVAVGDPARAEFIANELLRDSRLVNRERGFLVYTGYYDGLRVSVAVHGVGGPSSAIVFEELHMLGAKTIIRLGTCGGLVEWLDIGDAVVVTGASYNPGGTLGAYVPDACMTTSPNPILTTILYDEAKKVCKKVFLGPVFSSDAFYAEDPQFARKWASRGVIAVEMEAATLFALATLRGFNAAAILIVSDNLVVPGKEELKTHEELKEYVRRAAIAVLNTFKEYEARQSR